MFGFTASAPFRLLLALLYAGTTALLVWAVEQDRNPVPGAVIAVTTTRTLPLRLEATFPVARGNVTGGMAVDVTSDGHGWVGTVTAPVGGELLVEATAAPGVSGFQGVKARLGFRDTALWGEGGIVGTVKVP